MGDTFSDLGIEVRVAHGFVSKNIFRRASTPIPFSQRWAVPQVITLQVIGGAGCNRRSLPAGVQRNRSCAG